MTDTKGIKQTMNVLALGFTIAEFLAREIKGDGLQWSDVFKLLAEEGAEKRLGEILANYSELRGELIDISSWEVIKIAEFSLQGTRRLIQVVSEAA